MTQHPIYAADRLALRGGDTNNGLNPSSQMEWQLISFFVSYRPLMEKRFSNEDTFMAAVWRVDRSRGGGWAGLYKSFTEKEISRERQKIMSNTLFFVYYSKLATFLQTKIYHFNFLRFGINAQNAGTNRAFKLSNFNIAFMQNLPVQFFYLLLVLRLRLQ